MFVSDEWTHLALNLETAVEGAMIRKTLTAFVNCSRVWDVGLYIDKPQKNAKKKFVTITLGPNDELSDICEGLVHFGDVHILKETSLSPPTGVSNFNISNIDIYCGQKSLNESLCF